MSKTTTGNNSGLFYRDIISTGALYINGKKFEQYISELVIEDNLEQGEIDEIKLLLQYLNTSGLSSEWIVDNNNKNQDLKTLITALETKLANIDTTTLTQSSVLTDDNRNSVLKSRIDDNDGSLSTLTNKTRYISESIIGNNSAIPKTPNRLSINVNTNPTGVHLGELRMEAGSNLIQMKNNSQTLQDLNYNDNQMTVRSLNGMLTTSAHLNRIQAQNKIEIGDFGIQNSAAINIGGKGAQINIGSIDDPDAAPSTNTIITIGKRANIRNTQTNIQGNIYTNEARWEDLPVSTGITLANIYSLLSGSAPSYVLGAFVSSASGFNYSDIVHMNLSNPIQKNKDITTSKGIVVETFKLFDNSPISVFPKSSTYFVNGDIVSTQVVGKNITSVFKGQIKLENHNTLNPLDINWAFSQDDERVNVIDVKDDDGIFIHQGASTANQPLRILNSCGSGGIELKIGGSTTNPDSRGKKEHAVGGIFLRRQNQLCASIVKEDPDVLPSFKRKTNNNNAQVDYRLLVSVDDDIPAGPFNNGAQQNHGIVVINEAKHLAIEAAAFANATQPVFTEYTAIDEDNITTPSLTFLGNYAGTTTKTLYTNANSDLMWDGQPVAVGSIAASGGGLTYVISAPSNTSVTHANQVPTSLTMSSTYTSAPLRTATLSSYNNNTNYQIVSIVGAIPKAANPILSGTYELNQFVDFASNVSGRLYGKLYFTGLPVSNILINKIYTGPGGSGNTLNLTTPQILVPANDVSITFSSITFPSVSIGGPDFNITTLTVTLVDQTSAVLYTFPLVMGQPNTTFDRVFTPPSPVTITDTTNITSLRFNLNSSNSNCVLNQTVAASATNARYILEGSSIRMLLYDGTTNPTTIAPNANTLYALSLPLPATPFVITDYQSPNITLEEWFIQPTGTTSNHTLALRFNDTALSHLHTSISSISATPTLSSVMTAGNSVGNTSLNMNGQDITNCNTITATTVAPNFITGWNVKSLTAGSGITAVNNGSGTWTITNTGVLTTPTIAQVLTAGSAGSNQNLSGIASLTATTVNATNIPSWNVKQITAGSGGVVVSNDGLGTYTISNDMQPSGGYLSAEYDYPITASTPISQKQSWYGQDWSRMPSWTTNTVADVYFSANGKYMAVASRGINLTPVGIFYSTNYNLSYSTSALTKNWRSITGTTTGDAIWAIQGGTNENGVPYTREIWRSNNFGVSWTQQTGPSDFQDANPSRIRVSADGKYQLMNDGRTNGLGKLYRSTDYGVTWTSKNLTTVTGTVGSVCLSANGAIQYAEISGTSEGLLTNTGSGGIYRSEDYGVNFNRVNTTDPIWNMSCDATGRIICATTNTGVLTSQNYGQTWATLAIAGATAVAVCPAGNIIWIGCINQTSTTELYFSDDYGQSFSVRNQNPQPSYISTSYLAIGTDYDGSTIVGGGNDNLNRFRTPVPEVFGVYAGPGISVTSPFGLGSWQISSTGSEAFSTYVATLNLTQNTYVALPTSMNLQTHDYELDIYVRDLTSHWTYLRFQNFFNGVAQPVPFGLTLIYNPSTTTTGAINLQAGSYTSAINNLASYLVYPGTQPSPNSQNFHYKATYKLSSTNNTTFFASLMNNQPMVVKFGSQFLTAANTAYAPYIVYGSDTNHPTRWIPQDIAIGVDAGGSFSGATIVIRQNRKN